MRKATSYTRAEGSDPHLNHAKVLDTSSRTEKVTQHPKSADNTNALNGVSGGPIVLGVDAVIELSVVSTTIVNITYLWDYRKRASKGREMDSEQADTSPQSSNLHTTNAQQAGTRGIQHDYPICM